MVECDLDPRVVGSFGALLYGVAVVAAVWVGSAVVESEGGAVGSALGDVARVEGEVGAGPEDLHGWDQVAGPG